MSNALKSNVAYSVHTGRTQAGITVSYDKQTQVILVVFFIGKGQPQSIKLNAKRVKTVGLIAALQQYIEHFKHLDAAAKRGKDAVRLLNLVKAQCNQL